MKRHISVVLLDACEEALLSMAGNAEYEQIHFDRPPTSWVNWVMWWRGFAAGLVGDRNNIPILDRLRAHCKTFRGHIAPLVQQSLRTWNAMIDRSKKRPLSAGSFSSSLTETPALLVASVDDEGNRSMLSIGGTGYGKGHRPVGGHTTSELATPQGRKSDAS